MKIKYAILHISSIAILFLTLVGCNGNNTIYENNEDCAVYVELAPFVQTPCENAPTYPPGVDRISVFAVDERGKVIANEDFDNISLSKELRLKMPEISGKGVFTFYTWAGTVTSDYEITNPASNLNEGSLSLIRTSDAQVHNKIFHSLYYGAAPQRIDVDPAEGATTYTVPVRLDQYTNDFDITFFGIVDTRDYTVEIVDKNADYLLDGVLNPVARPITYSAQLGDPDPALADPVTGNKPRKATLRTLKLYRANAPKIILRDAVNGEEKINLDLIEDLLLKMPTFNIECDHSFDIEVRIKDGAYITVEIYVNGWHVHSYDTDLSF